MLAILTTHPIQYQVPLWQAMARDGRVPFEVWYLCDHAVRATHDPEFGRAFAWDLGKSSLEGYPHRFLGINQNWSLHPSDFLGIRLRKSLAPLFRERGVTALWIQGWQKLAYWQAVSQARRAGVEVWLRGETNDLAPRGSGLKGWLKNTRLRWLFARIDRFLCIGAANQRFYRSHKVPEAKLFSAPYCVDNARFATKAATLRAQRSEFRRQWGIADEAFCVLFCGKFIPKKRPLDLVAASERVVERGAPLHLLFVGSGELEADLRGRCEIVFDAESNAFAPNHSLNQGRPKASFAGFLNQVEISRAYIAADVLVLPSDHGETWGLVVNEAMASGVPCIASDAVGCSEDLVIPVDPHLRYPFGDLEGLARALARVRLVPPRPELLAQVVRGHDYSATIDTVAAIVCSSSASQFPEQVSQALASP